MYRKFYFSALLFVIAFLWENSPNNPHVIFTKAQSTIDSLTIDSSLFDLQAILNDAELYLRQAPVPITDFICERSDGGINDFYSEGDYWWPDPENPAGPYIRKDGQSNPNNFNAHRLAMRNLSRWVACLTAAYLISKEKKYAKHAINHLQVFFLDAETKMNPHLLYGQAIKGRVSGRGIGIIDSIHFIEIAKSIQILLRLGYITKHDQVVIDLKQWFQDYTDWLVNHPFGQDEMMHGNNHSTWWAAQVAAFADLLENEDYMSLAIQRGKDLISEQMAVNGSFPEELERTKPYNYSLFNLEGYAILCAFVSYKEDLWSYQGTHGSLKDAWDFMIPYIADKSTWIKEDDVQYFDLLPTQSTGIFLAACAYQSESMLKIWKNIPKKSFAEEIDRTYPARQPILWVNSIQ